MAESLSPFSVPAFACPWISHYTHQTSISIPPATNSRSLAPSTINRTHNLHPRNVSNALSTERNPEARRRIREVITDVSPHRAFSAVRLLRIEQGGAFSDLLSGKGRNAMRNEMDYVERTLGFRTRDLEDRDIRLVSYIVGGAVRWKRYLDHLIMSLCNEDKTFRDMEPLLLQILRIGIFEINKLGMPPYAVVDENVKLAKTSLRPGAGNMVNGILRKLVLLKEKDILPLPKVEGDERAQARAIAIIHSHPVMSSLQILCILLNSGW